MSADVLDGQVCWIVGQHVGDTWDFQGVFATEDLAVAACTHPSYFVGPATLNEALPHETSDWPGSYYPIIQSGGA